MGFRRKIQESPKVDLTPMIDVVFLLLIFFHDFNNLYRTTRAVY